MEARLAKWQSITSFSRIVELFLFFSVRHFQWMDMLFWVVVLLTTVNTLVSGYWLGRTFQHKRELDNPHKLLAGFSITFGAGILVLLVLLSFLM